MPSDPAQPRRCGIVSRHIFQLAFFVFFALALTPAPALAAPLPRLTYQYQEQIFTLDPNRHPSWRQRETVIMFRGIEITLPEEMRNASALPAGTTTEQRLAWNPEEIASTLEEKIGKVLRREAGTVRILKNAEGQISFEGQGLPGRTLDTRLAAELTAHALAEGIGTVQLPLIEKEATVIVEDPDLLREGIREVVAVGESDFAGSPVNRIYNIGVGMRKLSGGLTPAGSEFSFLNNLGPVNAKTGYRNELTIKGDRTIPDYGGGLCQVSTTVYRAAWSGGFPITERTNHSFAVRYYEPPGTDATVYTGVKNLRFRNDTDGALLLQTFTEGTRAYALYYGTRPRERKVELIGPFTWDFRSPPPDRLAFTTEIPPGEKRVVGHRVPGMKAVWYRATTNGEDAEQIESFFSSYESRPFAEEIGVAEGDPRLMTAELPSALATTGERSDDVR